MSRERKGLLSSHKTSTAWVEYLLPCLLCVLYFVIFLVDLGPDLLAEGPLQFSDTQSPLLLSELLHGFGFMTSSQYHRDIFPCTHSLLYQDSNSLYLF